MPLAPSSPVLPSARRHPSSLDLSSTSPSIYTNGFGPSPLPSPQTPRSSFPQSPLTPRHRSSICMGRPTRFSGDFTGEIDSGGGLGSLADELASAWDEDGEGDEDVSGFQ